MNDDRIENLERELNALYYSISHDLRAPLRAIDGFSLAVLEDCGPRLDEDGRRYLERVRGAAQKMTLMIDGLLDISRLNREPLLRKPIDLESVASELIGELQKRDEQRAVSWIPCPPLVADADAKLSRALLAALLDNAWKFTVKNPAAEIRFSQSDGVFTVADNGVGFDSTQATRLFSAFQRFHLPEEFPGTGIGLARAARIVARHGGRIWADAAPGRGASFHFILGSEPTSGATNADT